MVLMTNHTRAKSNASPMRLGQDWAKRRNKMNSEEANFESILPTGDELRVLLNQPYVTATLLRLVLRQRGVFIDSLEKKDLIPPLLLSYLTPDEFEFLISSARQAEDAPKIRSHSYPLQGDNPSLASLLPDSLDLSEIAGDPYGNYEFLNSGNFVKTKREGREIFVLDYKIKTTDITSDWMHSNRVFSGEIAYGINVNAKVLEVMTTHSSTETQKINKLIAQKVDRTLIKKDAIKDEVLRIRFNSFDNESRIRFFMRFTKLPDDTQIKFEKLTDLSLKLDESKTIKDNQNLEWMRGKVSSVRLGGKAIQETFFVTDKTCRPYVIFSRIECKYSFNVADGEGTFYAVFEFPESSRKGNEGTEFQISIPKLSLPKRSGDSVLSEQLRKKFLAVLNRYKLEIFKEFAPQMSI
jgi:hypothetical protein